MIMENKIVMASRGRALSMSIVSLRLFISTIGITFHSEVFLPRYVEFDNLQGKPIPHYDSYSLSVVHTTMKHKGMTPKISFKFLRRYGGKEEEEQNDFRSFRHG